MDKKKIGLLTILIAIAIIFFRTETPESSQSPTPAVPYQATLTGEYICLPHRTTSGPQTLECALGIKVDTSSYYALDLGQLLNSDQVTKLPTGTPMTVEGLLVPIDQISSDQWQKYNVKGIMRVEKVTKISLNEGGETFVELSLPGLMEKDFDGRDLKLGQVLATTTTYTKYFITYKSGALTISGIMNIPKGDGPFPVVILNHGYIDPAIYTNGRGLRREQEYLASHGFAVLHTDYRNHAQSDKDTNIEANIRVGYIEDAINAVLAVKNSNISQLDKNKIGMLGHSMGGGVTQAVMVVKPDLIDAVVLYAPVSSDVSDNYRRWTTTRPAIAKLIADRYGTPEQDPKFWADLSPRTFFDNVEVPVLMFHGTADDSVPISWSRDTLRLLREQQKDVRLVEYPGQPHEFSSAHLDFMTQTAAFFTANLR
jgi:uncharacterized protein